MTLRCPNCYATNPGGSHCVECGELLVEMKWIQKIQQETHEWRLENIDNLAPIPQTLGTAGELLGEFGSLLVKEEYYGEGWADRAELEAEAGDVIIYFFGVLSLLDLDVVDCIEAALRKNEERDWDEHMDPS